MVLGHHTPLRPRRLFALSQLQHYHHPLQTPKGEAVAAPASELEPHPSPTDVAFSLDDGSNDFLLDGPPLEPSPPPAAPVFLFDLGDDDSADDERLDPAAADGDRTSWATRGRGSWMRRGRESNAEGVSATASGVYDFSAVLPGLEVAADLSGLLDLIVLKEPPPDQLAGTFSTLAPEPVALAEPNEDGEDFFASGLAQPSLEDLAPTADVPPFVSDASQGDLVKEVVRPDADSPLPAIEECLPEAKEDNSEDTEPVFVPLRAPSLDASSHGDEDKGLQIFRDQSDSPTTALATPPRAASPPMSPVRPLNKRPMLTIITDPDHQEEDSDDSGSRPLSNCRPIREPSPLRESVAEETVTTATEDIAVADDAPALSKLLPESPGNDKENDEENDTACLLGPKGADETHTSGWALSQKLKSKLESKTTTPGERYQALLRKLDAEVARVDAVHNKLKLQHARGVVTTNTPLIQDNSLSSKTKTKKYENDPVLVFEPVKFTSASKETSNNNSKPTLTSAKDYQKLTSPTKVKIPPPKSFSSAPEWAQPGYLAASRQQRLKRFRTKVLGKVTGASTTKTTEADAEQELSLMAAGPSLTSMFLSSNIEKTETTQTVE